MPGLTTDSIWLTREQFVFGRSKQFSAFYRCRSFLNSHLVTFLEAICLSQHSIQNGHDNYWKQFQNAWLKSGDPQAGFA